MKDNRLYIIYDERAILGDTDDAAIFVTCDSVKECLTYAGTYGGRCAVYSYAKKWKNLTDEKFEFVLSDKGQTQ